MNQATFLSYVSAIQPIIGNDGPRPFSDFRNQPSTHPRRRMLQRVNITLQKVSQDRYRMMRNLLGREISSTYDLTVSEGQAILNCAYPAEATAIDQSFESLLKDCVRPDPFPVLYVDPPWKFAAGGDRLPKYPRLTVKEMKKLPISAVAAPDSVLLMWATYPFLDQAIELGKAWGFKYKTVGLTWVKPNKHSIYANDIEKVTDDSNWANGTGYWTMANAEVCLLFTKGHPKRISKSVRQLVVAPREAHSKKPDICYDRVEQLLEGTYLEIFARQTRKGWFSLGNDIDGKDIRDSLPELISTLRSNSNE